MKKTICLAKGLLIDSGVRGVGVRINGVAYPNLRDKPVIRKKDPFTEKVELSFFYKDPKGKDELNFGVLQLPSKDTSEVFCTSCRSPNLRISWVIKACAAGENTSCFFGPDKLEEIVIHVVDCFIDGRSVQQPELTEEEIKQADLRMAAYYEQLRNKP